MIIDIIDGHDIFKRQWLKRRTFYQKNGYKIKATSNYKEDKWEEIITIKKGKKGGNQNKKDELSEIPMGKCLISIE